MHLAHRVRLEAIFTTVGSVRTILASRLSLSWILFSFARFNDSMLDKISSYSSYVSLIKRTTLDLADESLISLPRTVQPHFDCPGRSGPLPSSLLDNRRPLEPYLVHPLPPRHPLPPPQRHLIHR
ncbi:hypothetical protein GB937_005536 [Aspergillus fischeri]|nr:hypothetical protein GB937_005536 [Aspergillus fischeri]